MTVLIAMMTMMFAASRAFAGDTGREKTVPIFTNEDLEKYSGKPPAAPAVAPEKEESLPGTEREVDAGAVFRENNGAVLAVVAYYKGGIPSGHGSGFIIGRDGTVVTSFHVISNAAEVRIKSGGKVIPVEGLLYSDRENDIALLKAKGTNFQAVVLGDSESVREGEKVYVMGNPRAEKNILSEGLLIGAKELGNYRRMLQITAPFSEGMSGGPVFNKNGEAIGIASFVLREARSAQSSQGLNFAVPINIVKDAVTARKVIDFKDIRTEDRTQTAEHWFILGNNLSSSGKYAEAEGAYRKALEIDPGLAGALNGLGVAYTRLTRYREAIGAFRQALRLEPDSAWIHSNLGLAFMESGMDREAVDASNQAVRIMPELGAAHFNLGLTYRRMGMYEEAAESFRNAVRANPQSAEAHFHLGVMYTNLKKRDAALEEYRILKDLDPALAERLSNMMKR